MRETARQEPHSACKPDNPINKRPLAQNVECMAAIRAPGRCDDPPDQIVHGQHGRLDLRHQIEEDDQLRIE
jgi:hypothetical protein